MGQPTKTVLPTIEKRGRIYIDLEVLILFLRSAGMEDAADLLAEGRSVG